MNRTDSTEETEREFFVVAHSNAAPFVSDTSYHYVSEENVASALATFVATYKHPSGLYAADMYGSADEYHKNGTPLAKYRSEKAKVDYAR